MKSGANRCTLVMLRERRRGFELCSTLNSNSFASFVNNKRAMTVSEGQHTTQPWQERDGSRTGRTVAHVRYRARYVWAERDRALIETGLRDPEDLHIGGVARGLGRAVHGGNAGSVERIPGFAVARFTPTPDGEDEFSYRKYLSPFYRSLLGDTTAAVRAPGNEGGYDVERRVEPERLADYVNTEYYVDEVFLPGDFDYLEWRHGHGRVADPLMVERAYKVWARLLVIPHYKKLESSPQRGLCLVCGSVDVSTCDECDHAIGSVHHSTPLGQATVLAKSAHRLFNRRTAESVVGVLREELARIVHDDERLERLVPGREDLFGSEEVVSWYEDRGEGPYREARGIPWDPGVEPQDAVRGA